jgi:hypothetical protein
MEAPGVTRLALGLMVQSLENWSVLRGRVRSISDDPQHADLRRVALSVEDVNGVDGFAPAVDDVKGRTVDIAVPRTTADALALAAGSAVEVHARATPGGLFAHPDRTRLVRQ